MKDCKLRNSSKACNPGISTWQRSWVRPRQLSRAARLVTGSAFLVGMTSGGDAAAEWEPDAVTSVWHTGGWFRDVVGTEVAWLDLSPSWLDDPAFIEGERNLSTYEVSADVTVESKVVPFLLGMMVPIQVVKLYVDAWGDRPREFCEDAILTVSGESLQGDSCELALTANRTGGDRECLFLGHSDLRVTLTVGECVTNRL